MDLAGPELISSSIYALYVGMGFRSIFNSFTELKKTAGIYHGIYDIIGSVKDCRVYNDAHIIESGGDQFKEYQLKQTQHFQKKQNLFQKVEPVDIEFRNVNFKYQVQNEEKVLFRNLSLKFSKGKVISIIGQSGSGNEANLPSPIERIKKEIRHERESRYKIHISLSPSAERK